MAKEDTKIFLRIDKQPRKKKLFTRQSEARMKRMKMILALVAASSMFAVPALAVISGTPHDLSSAAGAEYGATNTTEMCVFCHTPHEASTSGPLWNRSFVSATAVYGDPSSSINATLPADYDSTDAGLCLSCHDGASMTAALVNEPNAADLTWNAGAGNAGEISGTANLGTDLSNDHPIGFEYDEGGAGTLVTDDGELESRANVEGATGMTGAISYGGTSNQMWCSSCHDVHNNANGAFLRRSNANSALCTTCHIK